MTNSLVEPVTSEHQETSVSPGLNLRIGRSLRLHRILALTVAAAVFVMLVAFGLSRKPQYEVQSLIYIQPNMANLVTDTTPGFYDSTRYESFVQQQLQTIVRSDILLEALKELPAGTWQTPGEPMQSAVARLQANLKVERVQGSYEVAVSMKGQNPSLITKTVNAVASAYLRKGRVDEFAEGSQQLQLLIEERKRILNELTRDRSEQAGLSSSLGVADTTQPTSDPYDAQLAELRKAVASARAAHEVALAQLNSVTSDGVKPSDAMNAASEDLISSDPSLLTLKRSVTERRALLTSQMAGLTLTNPLYNKDQEELAQLDQALSTLDFKLRGQAAQQLQAKLRLEVTRTSSIKASLEQQMAKQTSIATHATPLLQRAADLTTDITRLQARFTATDNAVNNLQLQQSSAGIAHVSLAAVQPQSAKSGIRTLAVVLALPFALAFGTSVAVLAMKLDKKIYIGEDLKRVVGFQPMSVLPNPVEVDPSVVEEFMLRLGAGIDGAHRKGGVNVYAFTAASRDMEIAEIISLLSSKMDDLGYRVAVVDASTVMKKLAAAESKERSKDGPSPRSLRSGLLPPGDGSTAALGTFEQIRHNADLVFITTSPLLASAEAEFVVRLADLTLIMAASASSKNSEVTDTLALVQRLKARGVAVVLTDVSLRHADSRLLEAVRAAELRSDGSESKRDQVTEGLQMKENAFQ